MKLDKNPTSFMSEPNSLLHLLYFHDDAQLKRLSKTQIRGFKQTNCLVGASGRNVFLYQRPPGKFPLVLVVPAEQLSAQQLNICRRMEGVARARWRGGVHGFF